MNDQKSLKLVAEALVLLRAQRKRPNRKPQGKAGHTKEGSIDAQALGRENEAGPHDESALTKTGERLGLDG